MDLITKLRAKLDLVEQVALAATPGPWAWAHLGHPYKYGLTAGGQVVLPSAAPDVYPHRDDAAHIVAHDPAATLRMVVACRKILDDCETSYRAKLDAKPEDEAEMWHRTGQGYVWHKVIVAIAEGYGIEP